MRSGAASPPPRGSIDSKPVPGSGGGVRDGQRREEVPRRLGRAQQILGEPHAERLLQPGEELHPAEAVEPEIALQGGVEGDRAGPALRLQLPGEPLDDLQDVGGGGGGGFLGDHGASRAAAAPGPAAGARRRPPRRSSTWDRDRPVAGLAILHLDEAGGLDDHPSPAAHAPRSGGHALVDRPGLPGPSRPGASGSCPVRITVLNSASVRPAGRPCSSGVMFREMKGPNCWPPARYPAALTCFGSPL